jgi:exosortase family protein XrtM
MSTRDRGGSDPGSRVLIRAIALMALLYGVYYYSYDAESWAGRAIDAYLRLQALAAGALIALFDRSASAAGTLISGRFPIQIVKSCSSLDAQALYVASVIALPASIIRKVLGVMAGVVALTAVNLARIASLYFVGALVPAWFDAVHEEILPLVLVVCACAMFLVWMRWARASASATAV